MKSKNIPFLSVGIDVGADFSLMAAALPSQEIASKNYKILHSSLDSIQGAVRQIRTLETRHGLRAKIFMESTGIYHYPLYYRLKDEGFDVFILNPIITHANTNIDVRGIHNDKFDAQKIALLGLKPKLKTSVVPNDDVAAVKVLMREYHAMKKGCSSYICRLKAQLRQTFPQYLSLFSKVNGNASLEILYRYTTPDTILAADREELTVLIMRFASKGCRAVRSYECWQCLSHPPFCGYDTHYDGSNRSSIGTDSRECDIPTGFIIGAASGLTSNNTRRGIFICRYPCLRDWGL